MIHWLINFFTRNHLDHSMSTDPKKQILSPNTLGYLIFTNNFSCWFQQTNFFVNCLRFHAVMGYIKWLLVVNEAELILWKSSCNFSNDSLFNCYESVTYFMLTHWQDCNFQCLVVLLIEYMCSSQECWFCDAVRL